MKAVLSCRFLIVIVLLFAFGTVGLPQSKVQKVERPTGNGKKNQRPTEKTEEERKKEEEQRRLEEEARTAEKDDEAVVIKTNIVKHANVQKRRVFDPVTKRTLTLTLTTRALRTLDKIGLQAYLRKYGAADPAVKKALGL